MEWVSLGVLLGVVAAGLCAILVYMMARHLLTPPRMTDGKAMYLLRRLTPEDLGLPFEAACLDFHKSDRAVRTASSEQVRRPVNRDGVGQWRPMEAWLAPLVEALGPALTDYPASS